ncbi:MAG: radical SAM protein, partial [Bacteroidetes bacterium]|nr:radical SAM protein [Bacteroidota bacterium]
MVKGIIRRIRTMSESAKESPDFEHIDKAIYTKYNKTRPEGPQKLFCYVPFNNISFSFKGRVLACAYNQKVELGKYPDQSIHDMWFNSAQGNALREHLEHNDLSYGCKHCKYFFENEKFSGLKPLVFDKYSNSNQTSYPKVFEFELSNQCNYECVMCNGHVSSSIRENRDKLPPLKSPYDDAFVAQLAEFIPHLEEAKFYGGEPFLIPIYYKIWDKMLELNPKIKIFVITNGSALNNRIKNMLESGNFDIAVSMDSLNRERLEGIRLNARKDVMLKHIDYFNDYCKRNNKNLVISFTLMRYNWMDFAGMVEFCNEIGATIYVSYLKTPPQFGLWNLPAEDLASIYEQVKDVSFEKGKYFENQNRQVYEDFKTYLVHAVETSKTRDPSEIIPFQDGLSPIDVMDGGLVQTNPVPTSENNGNSDAGEMPVIKTGQYNPGNNYRIELKKAFVEAGQTKALQKLDGIINDAKDQVDANRL